jgi:hypothetical protein
MSWWSKHITHAISRLFGGESGAEKRQRASLLEQEDEVRRETETRKNILSRLRQAASAGEGIWGSAPTLGTASLPHGKRQYMACSTLEDPSG